MTTFTRLKDILVSEYKLRPEALQPEARLDELGIDSLGVMELLFKIEEEFQITVPTDQVELATVSDVVAYIDRLVDEQSAGAAQTSPHESKLQPPHPNSPQPAPQTLQNSAQNSAP